MKKIISIILITSMLICMLICPVNANAYGVPGGVPLTHDSFDQGAAPFNYRENLATLMYPMHARHMGYQAYEERLQTDYFNTIDDLLTIFEIGQVEDYSDEYNNIASALGVTEEALNIYKKDEINDIFNAYYGTNVDLLELPELCAGKDYCKSTIYGDYFVYYLPNNGYITIEYDALYQEGYKIGNAEYWIFTPTEYEEVFDTAYAITQTETVCGHTFPAIKYIGFEPPSDDIISQYTGTAVTQPYTPPYTPQESEENTAQEIPLNSSGLVDVYADIDMDNDGNAESVHIYETYKEYKEYHTHIEINGQAYSLDSDPRCWIRQLCVVDLNKSDNAKELMICEGYHSYSTYYMVRYENGTITPMLFYNGSGNSLTTESYNWSSNHITGTIYASGDGALTIYGKTMDSSINDKYTEYARGVLTLFGICVNDDYTEAPNNFTIKVKINGSLINFENPPVMIDDRTFVPMRAIFEALGATVSWDDNTQTVSAVSNGIKAILTIGDNKIYVNNIVKYIDSAARLIDGVTYVPVRVVAEALGSAVSWDEIANTVNIEHTNAKEIRVYLDKKRIDIDADIASMYTSVDAERLCKFLKLTYIKNEDGSITIQKDNKLMTFSCGDEKYICSFSDYPNSEYRMDFNVIPYIKDNSVMVSLDDVCKYFGGKLNSYGNPDKTYDIYITSPVQLIPNYTDNEEYNKFIYSKLKLDTPYVYLNDYDYDGDEEAFVFYKRKHENGLTCDLFDFGSSPYTKTNIFMDKDVGDIYFEEHDTENGVVLEMVSDWSFIEFHYGYFVMDNEGYQKQLYAVANTPNYNVYADIHNYNSSVITAKYEYLDGTRDTIEAPMYVPKKEGEYWGIYKMEVEPEFLKTFKNGESIYKHCIEEKIANGDKVQVLYATNNTIHINNKHYDEKENRIVCTYQNYIFRSETPNTLESADDGRGNIPSGPWWWWLAPIIPEIDNIAYEYECDTSEYFNDNTTWLDDAVINDVNANLRIYFNGKLLELTKEIQTKNDRTMYPMRECLELIGAEVSWNDNTGEACAELNGNKIIFKINSSKYLINGVEKEMDVEAYVDDFTNSTYIPIRYAAEELGYNVSWIPGRAYNTIIIGNEDFKDVVSITDRTQEIKSSSNAAVMGKYLYQVLDKNNFMQEIETMNKASLSAMKSIISSERAQKFESCILDVSTTLIDGVIATYQTATGNIDAGIDYINDSVMGFAGDAITNIADPQSTDELVRAMCNSAFDENMQLTEKLTQYHYKIGKSMTDKQYEEYLKMYQKFIMNNRTLMMGSEYFTENIPENIYDSYEKVAGELLWAQAKNIVKDITGWDEGIMTLTDAVMYKTTENFLDAVFEDFEKSQSPALKSWAKDMKAKAKQFEKYLRK